jgi:FixJ family two-component response regulator
MQEVVHILDDDPVCVEMMRAWLVEANFSVCAHADVQSLFTACHSCMLGCLLLDIKMPGMSGLQVQDILKERRIALPIIFITGHGDISMSVSVIKKGALDFLVKPLDQAVLLATVGEAINQSVSEHEKKQALSDLVQLIDGLSSREKSILKRMAAGLSGKEIAREIYVSLKTVEYYRPRIMKKLNVDTLPDLVRRVDRYQAHKTL